jgi:hypothetical protein
VKAEGSPQSSALVASRVIGLVALLGGLLALPRVFARHRALMRGETGLRPLYRTSRATHTATGRAEEKFMVVEQRPTERDIHASFISAAAALILGVGFLVLSRPIARMLAKGSTRV